LTEKLATFLDLRGRYCVRAKELHQKQRYIRSTTWIEIVKVATKHKFKAVVRKLIGFPGIGMQGFMHDRGHVVRLNLNYRVLQQNISIPYDGSASISRSIEHSYARSACAAYL
jgi:hypothetical protein